MKKILITGAGGSIGSELANQVYNSSDLPILLDKNLDRVTHLKCIKEIANVCNQDHINSIIRKYKPDVVIHAAANKYVPELEHDPKGALVNNVFGTCHVVNSCLENQVEKFILISTDKAVQPVSIMGRSKRAAELYSLNAGYSCVRLVNVLGSVGSVVEIFNKQIDNGNPITVTDPEMTRYFMSVTEACELIRAASNLAEGGDIFILDGGPALRIVDLAQGMIARSGKVLPIIYSGIRPGERLHEVAMLPDPLAFTTKIPKIWKIQQNSKQENAHVRRRNAEDSIKSLLMVNPDSPEEIVAELKAYL